MSANTPNSPPEVNSSTSSITEGGTQEKPQTLRLSSDPGLVTRPRLLNPQSSSSIQTLSKIYDQQQQAERLSPVTSRSSKKHSTKIPQILPDLRSKKKLHKRVLSSSSINNDFLSQLSASPRHEESPTGILTNSSSQSNIILPSFQTMDSIQNKRADNLKLPENLTTSKIYERRKNREMEEELESKHMSNPDQVDDVLLQEDSNIDEVVRAKYNEKLNQMKNSNRKVEFYESDEDNNKDSDVSENEESDIDINSEPESPKLEAFPESGSIHSNESKLSTGTSSSSSNEKKRRQTQQEGDDKKNHGFRGFLRRMTMVDELDDIPESLKRSKTIEGEEEGFFSKFLNVGGGGLIPGASINKDDRSKPNDEEAQNHFTTEDGIEMQNLDPQQFKDEAKKLLQSHMNAKRHRSPNVSSSHVDSSDQTTLRDSMKSNDGSFLAPNPEVYLNDNGGKSYDLQLDDDDSFIPPPDLVRGGVLSSLLKLYQNPEEASRSKLTLVSSDNSPLVTPDHEKEEFLPSDYHASIAGRLKKLAGKKIKIDDANLKEQENTIKKHRKNASFGDIGELLGSHSNKRSNLPSFQSKKVKSSSKIASGLKRNKREHTQAKITVHIAETLQRQRFIIRLCKCLMLYGAPTHRLEEYLTMTARVLEIDAQFIYLPGCMIMAFGDATTRTSEVRLVRCNQGLDLYKLHRAHRIYKRVIHDLIGVEDASVAIDDLLSSKPLFSRWQCVLIYAFSSAMVTPFAFGGGWYDLPVSFCIGGCVGGLQYYISPRSNLYSNVFEVTASIVVSFIGRALGSIHNSKICFSAVVQGSLALILPGYIILCGALELQSRNLVSGAVRMFYAVIYSLFLGFGLTMGSALYGWIDKNATSEVTCANSIDPWYRFIFVPGFTLGLALINQAKWFQLPIMLFISSAGYVISFFSQKYFSDSTEFTASLAAFVIGVLGNLYSRIWKGIAVSAMLPGIFLQVPGGVGSQSTLLSGIQTADRITGNTTARATAPSSGMEFGITMVQIVIGISVGLFASTIAVYPFGKKSTSLFTL